MIHAHKATQGHRYALGDRQVLSMSTGHVVEVREINPAEPWLGKPESVKASWLQPVPMKYFGGLIP